MNMAIDEARHNNFPGEIGYRNIVFDLRQQCRCIACLYNNPIFNNQQSVVEMLQSR